MNGKITWQAELPLFGPEMLKGWSLAMLVTGIVMSLLMAISLGPSGDWEGLANILLGVWIASTGLWLFGFLVMALLYRGRTRMRYTLSDTGLVCETLDTVTKRVNRLAILVGVLGGRPGVLGAGLIGRSRETEAIAWNGAFRAELRPARQLIVIKGAWRSLMLVQCTPDNYATVAARIEAELASHASPGRVAKKSPLPGYLLRSGLVVLASTPIFLVHEEYHLDSFLPLLMFCFALATVWLVPLFGWVILGSLGLIGLRLGLTLAEERPSLFAAHADYRRFEVLSADDWLLLAIAGLGAAWLVWLSIGALRGRIQSALIADYGDMEGS